MKGALGLRKAFVVFLLKRPASRSGFTRFCGEATAESPQVGTGCVPRRRLVISDQGVAFKMEVWEGNDRG